MRFLKESFNAGEFTPRLYSRYELAKYKNGCKTLTNFVPTPHGPVTRRPGTEYIGQVKTSSKYTRLIPFIFSANDSYVIEFGDLYCRFFRNGGQIWTADANTDLLLHFDGENNSTTITDDGSTTHTVTAVGNAKLKTVNKKFGTASVLIEAAADYLSVPDHADWYMGTGEFTIDFWVRFNTPTTAAGIFCNNANPYSSSNFVECFLTNSGTEIHFNSYSGGVSQWQLNFTGTTFAADTWYHIALIRGWGGDSNSIACTVNGEALAGTTDVTGKTWPDLDGIFGIGTFYLVDAFIPINGYIDEFRVSKGTARWTTSFAPPTRQYPFADSSGTVYEIVTTYAEKDLANLYFVQSADTMYIVHENYVVRKLVRTGHANWGISDVSFTNAPDEWGAADYPRTVEFFEDRLCFGGNPNNPDKVYCSDTGLYTTFTETDASADETVQFTLAARRVNDIKWLVGSRNLLIGTGGEEWWSSGPSDTEPMTPSDHIAKRDSGWGSARVMPVDIGDAVFYVQRNGRSVKEMRFDWSQEKYVSSGMNVLAEHLTKTYTITAIAYQQHPYQILWCIREDGTLLALTYLKEHDVIGWSKHTSGTGQFESIAVIPGDPEDEVWFVVKRTIDGSTVRYIERLKHFYYGTSLDDAIYVDCSLTYDGASTFRISGLSHLANEVVDVLADGSPQTSLTIGDTVASNTSLLLHCDGADTTTTFIDDGSTTHYPVAVGTAQHDTSVKKFGGASLLLDGDSDYLTVPDHADWNFGSSAFTIDFWVRLSSVAVDAPFVIISDSVFDAETMFQFYWGSGGSFIFEVFNGSPIATISQTFAWSPVVDTWYHIALIRGWGGSANNVAVTVNGTQVGSTLDVTGVTIPNFTGSIGIGGYSQMDQDIDGPLNGYLDEIRISKGVARWTAAFTPETSAYPSGNITISTASSKVHVGLPYTPEFETLDIVASDDSGSLQGCLKRITNVSLRLIDSQGGLIGPDSSTTDSIPYDDETSPYTGWTKDISFEEDYDRTSTVYVTCDEPLPLEIAAILIDVED